MFCPKCGTANDDASRFCASCGLDLSPYQTQPGSSSQQPYQQPSQQAPPFQQPYQQPYQGQQPYQQPYRGMGYGNVPSIPSYMGWAIAVLILCFWPAGIFAVVHASRVNNRLALGDVAGAQESSRKAKMWCWIAFAIAIVWVVIMVIAIATGALTASGYWN